MSITLKDYQQKAVNQLEEYIKKMYELFEDDNPKNTAFYKLTENKYEDHGIDAPSICIKIPTGGGKTLVACESLRVIHREYFSRVNDVGLVVWLVPTEAILEQTVTALQNTKHAYNQTLHETFENIKVLRIGEALSLKKSDVFDSLCIIVSTYQAFRIEDTPEKRDKRNVFKESGELMDHFESNTGVITSLHEVIKLYKPIVILDEAHHAKTEISHEMVQNFNPSFVVEFTATPRQHEEGKESNVLVDVKAIELKKEGMIKMPIMHVNEPNWKETVDLGVKQRRILEKQCDAHYKRTNEHIRPIALIQAERDDSKNDERLVDVLLVKKHLMTTHKIYEEEIAIKTGTKDDLKGKNLLLKTSKIKYVITVKALAEGWDNPFAYVLISIMNNRSPTASEQILGRILRMPNQKRKSDEALNRAYVFTSSANFEDVVKKLQDELASSGYDKGDMTHVDGKEIPDATAIGQVIPDDDIRLPCLAITDPVSHILEYEELVNENITLDKKELPEIGSLVSAAGTAKHDVTSRGLSYGVIQKTLDAEESHYYTKEHLMKALKNNMRRKWCSSNEMNAYLEKIIDKDVGSGQNHDKRIVDLIKDSRTVIRRIKDDLDEHEKDVAKKRFDQLRKEDKIACISKSLSPEMGLPDPVEHHYKKHLYDRLESMNDEEKHLASGIDRLESVKWWYRNPNRNDNSFFISGWENRLFYPDFIVKTHGGKYFVIEYKGEQFKDSPDTKYKQEMLDILSVHAGKDYHVGMIFENNVNDIVNAIKSDG